MAKRWLIVLLCLVAIISLSACNSNNDEELNNSLSEADNNMNEDKIKVSVTFDAMKEFAAAVGKDKVEISTIIPSGGDSHDFQPKPQDLTNMSKADLFVYNGLGMDAWAEDAINAADNPELIVVEASKGADIIEIDEEADEHDHEGEDNHDHSHGKYDPHVWLSLKEAQVAAKNIKDALVEADPDNKDYYDQNYDDFASQLETLHNEYSEKFQNLDKKSFVTGHAAFGYLAREFDLKQNSIRNIFAEGEPSAQQLTQLIEYCKENDVTTIFSEEMASPEVSQTLANEVGAKVETLYTLENAQDDMTYLERMESNLSKIYDSLVN